MSAFIADYGFRPMNFESSKLYRIRATRRDDGSIDVNKLLVS
jgi:hypothetical protein